jgi:hypothetical protein
LQARFAAVALRRKHQPPRRLPQRRARDVGEADLPRRRGAAEAHLDRALVRRAGRRHRFRRALQARRQRRVLQPHLVGFAQQHEPQARLRQHRNAEAAALLVFVRAGQSAGRAARRDALAAQRPEQGGAAAEVLRAQRQAAESFPFEVPRREPHAFHDPGGVAQQQALQHVVDVLHRHAERDRLVGREGAGVLHHRQPGVGEGHRADGQFCGHGGRSEAERERGGEAHVRYPACRERNE